MDEKAFGSKIKAERESKGWALEKISDELRIPVKFLEGIERNDYNGFPGITYEKAFLRTYCKHLGLNSDDFIALLKELKGEKNIPAEKLEQELTPETTHLASRKKPKFIVPDKAKYGALAVLALVLLILFVAGIRQCGGAAGSGAAGTSVPGGPKLLLTADVTDDCWFEIVTDNEPANKMMLKAGDKREWQANNEFVLVIGKKDALKLEFNGKPVELGSHDKYPIKDLTLKREGAKDAK